MLNSLSIARELGRVSTPIRRVDCPAGLRGMVLWERHSKGPVDYMSPNHHTLSIYQGGGTGTYSCEKRSWGFAGAVCLMPEGFDTTWKNSSYVSNLHIYFTTADLEALSWTNIGEPHPVIFGQSALLQQLSATLIRDLDWNAPEDQLAVDHLLLAMLSTMNRSKPETTTGLSLRMLNRLEARMKAFDQGIPSLNELAQEAGQSPRHLTRQYKAATGKTLSSRQREIQLERATELLQGQMGLSEIAIASGFSSQSHFTNAFRRHFGTTPMRWRNRLR